MVVRARTLLLLAVRAARTPTRPPAAGGPAPERRPPVRGRPDLRRRAKASSEPSRRATSVGPRGVGGRRRRETKELVERASSLRPNDPTMLSNLGEVYRSFGDPQTGVALLRRAVAIAPLDLGDKRNLIAVLWDAQLYAEFCQASRELLAQICVSLDSPERAADPNFHFVERRARFDVADSAQRHRCHGASDDDAFRWFEAAYLPIRRTRGSGSGPASPPTPKVCWTWPRSATSGPTRWRRATIR